MQTKNKEGFDICNFQFKKVKVILIVQKKVKVMLIVNKESESDFDSVSVCVTVRWIRIWFG